MPSFGITIIIYGGLLTPFFGKKQVKKDKKKQPMKKWSTIGRLKEEENIQQDSPMVGRAQP
jgi:hypothetical protein